MTRLARWSSGFTLTLALCLAGPGCADPNKPVPVEGIVLLDEKPVEGATVSFIPEGTKGRPASGTTDAAGMFKLSSFRADDGAVPGMYKVIVSKAASDPTAPTGPPDPAAMIDIMQEKKKTQNILPKKYANPNKTPLTSIIIPYKGRLELTLESEPVKPDAKK